MRAEVTLGAAEGKTVISSDRMRVLGKGQSAEFTGRVRLTREEDLLTADRLVTEEKNTLARAWGGVYLRRELPADALRWEAWGDRGAYDTAAASGTLWGDAAPARARRSSSNNAPESAGRFKMEAPEILFRDARSTVPAQGGFAEGRRGVHLQAEEPPPEGRTTDLWADSMNYDGPGNRVVLSGGFARDGGPDGPPPNMDRPFARQRAGRDLRELRGRSLVYYPNDQRLSVSGTVEAYLEFDAGAVPGRGKIVRPNEENAPVPSR